MKITMKQFQRMVLDAIKPLRARVVMITSRGVIESVDDTKKMQTVKGSFLAGEARDGMERFQNFGFSSNPPPNTEAVAVFIGGNREHGIIVGCDDRGTRFTGLDVGESVQYNNSGHFAHLKNTGEFEFSIDKVQFKNDTGELIEQLKLLSEGLAAEPFIVNKALFTAIKIVIESFKV